MGIFFYGATLALLSGFIMVAITEGLTRISL